MLRVLRVACVVLVLCLGGASPALAWQTPVATPISLVGVEIVFSLNPDAGKLNQESLLGIRAMLQRRLEALGLSGQVIRGQDGDIIVHVDATDDPQQTMRALASPPHLEIIDTQGQYLQPGTLVRTTTPALGSIASPPPDALHFETIISGSDFQSVSAAEGSIAGVPVVAFTLTPEAAVRFYAFTNAHVGQPLAIVLDTQVLSTPMINGAIAAEGIIEGIPPEEIPALVAQLHLGMGEGLLILEESRVVP